MFATPPSPKPCVHCGKEFIPKYTTTQSVCSLRCAASYAKKERLAKEKQERAQDRAKRESFKKLYTLIAEAQDAFNEFVRLRDREKGCFVCGRPFNQNVPGQVMHAGHVRSRSAAGHLRFNEDNCLGECEGCNDPKWGAKPHEIEAGAIRRIGQERFDVLKNDNRVHKWSRDEVRSIRDTYRARVREMKKEQA